MGFRENVWDSWWDSGTISADGFDRTNGKVPA